MESLKKYLLKTVAFQEEEWATLEKMVEIRILSKGDLFIEQDKPCKNSGFILEGLMRYFSFDEYGNDPTCYFVDENNYILDPYAFASQVPSSMNLQAITKCRIAVISSSTHKLLQKHIPRWDDVTRQLILRIAMDFADQKDFLRMDAAKRYNYFVNQYPSFATRSPLKYIASYLSIAQQSLSRIRKIR